MTSSSNSRLTVAVVGGGRLAFGTLGMLRAAKKSGVDIDVLGYARAQAGRDVLDKGGARVVDAIGSAVAGADVVILAVPATALDEVAAACGTAATGDQVILHAARGVDVAGRLPHQTLRQHTCWKKIVVIGGPLYLDDAGSGRDLNGALASRFDEAIAMVKTITKGAPLRLQHTNDIVGVELCGALSNIGHLASGFAAGAGFSETDQGLLTVRALLEAGRLGRVLGASPATFSGLAGVGDLIPRRVSSQTRHRELAKAFVADNGHVDASSSTAVNHLEGAVSAVALATLARERGVHLPLVTATAAILEGASATTTLGAVLDLDLGLQAAG